MERRRLIVSVCVVALVALAVAPTLTGCVPLTPEQAAMYGAAPVGSSIRKVTGRLTGVMEEEMMWLDDDCNPAEGEFEYLYNIYEVGPDGAAAGSAHARLRSLNPPGRWVDFYVAVDCVQFTEVDGKPAAIYSGKVIKATMPECFTQAVCEWEGSLKIGMVIDGGTGTEGDEIVFWQPVFYCFYPDEGVPLGCAVPEGSQEFSFNVTGGDVVISGN